MARLRKPPTIQEVARVAGVSAATVSRALNTPELVSERARAGVDLAVRQTGYSANDAARMLRKGEAKAILVAVADLANPFFGAVLDAIERAAAARGFNILVANHVGARGSDNPIPAFLMSHRADGLILMDGTFDIDSLARVMAPPYSAPVVIACEEIPGYGVPTVVTNNRTASRVATQHLVDLGHRLIAHVSGPKAHILCGLRQSGWRDALVAADIEAPAEFVFAGDFGLESGARAARHLMALPMPPTAVFLASDEMAIGFVSELAAMGLSCPDDVSVVGFDDIEVAVRVMPPLTTIRQPREAIGRQAALALLSAILGKAPRDPDANVRTELPSALVVRHSTKVYEARRGRRGLSLRPPWRA